MTILKRFEQLENIRKNLREKSVLFTNQEFHYAMEYENFLMFDALLNEPGFFKNPDKKLYNYK